MTKKLIWRLKEQPSTESLRGLVKDGLLTKEEAHEILFSVEEESRAGSGVETLQVENLKAEIKFLRELVEKLSNGSHSPVVTIIKEIEVQVPTYKRYPWYVPYVTWCANDSGQYLNSGSSSSYPLGLTGGGNFTNIKTF